VSTAILSDKTRSRIQELINDIRSDGNYFVIKSGQAPQKITLNVDIYLGKITRTIQMSDGNTKEIKQHTFSVWNHSYSKLQTLQLSNRWIKKLLQTMLAHNTNTLIVSRQGDDIFTTRYNFEPAENESSSLLYEMYKKFGPGPGPGQTDSL